MEDIIIRNGDIWIIISSNGRIYKFFKYNLIVLLIIGEGKTCLTNIGERLMLNQRIDLVTVFVIDKFPLARQNIMNVMPLIRFDNGYRLC